MVHARVVVLGPRPTLSAFPTCIDDLKLTPVDADTVSLFQCTVPLLAVAYSDSSPPVGSVTVALSVIVSDPAGRSCPVDGTGGELVATIEPVGAVVAPAGSVPAKNPPVRAVAAADSATATEARTSA